MKSTRSVSTRPGQMALTLTLWGRHFLGQGLGESHQGKLGSTVDGVAGDTTLSRSGGDDDNLPATTPGHHVPGHGPRTQVGAADVDRHHLVEGVLLQVNHQDPVAAGAGTGVVDQDVNLAKPVQHLA